MTTTATATTPRFMAIDQRGQTIHGLTSPRRDLLAHFGRQRAEKMYLDRKGERPAHIGYIIAGHWLTVYRVERWEQPA